jgi:hypothetical protein
MSQYADLQKTKAKPQAAPQMARSTSPLGVLLNSSPRVAQLQAIGRQLNEGSAGLAGARPSARRNGLPEGLRQGAEALSGVALGDVQVHYNSSEPARLGAHAHARGSDIHLGPGQERHLPHEAWHVVQQKQGRVRPTFQLAGGAQVNDSPGLEREADVMGARAMRGGPGAGAPIQAVRARPLSGGAIVQRMEVNAGDVGQYFNITDTTGTAGVGKLIAIGGGGWYTFEVGGSQVKVRGQANILSRAAAPGGAPGGYKPDFLPTNEKEFNVPDLAKKLGISQQEVMMRARNSFREEPRTIRMHYSTGSKTIARGNPAYSTPDEHEMQPQAMVSYRKNDYGKHDKVGADYDEMADELSGNDTDEDDKQDRAQRMVDMMETDNDEDFPELKPGQKAAMGGLFSVGLISDPLRTEHNSDSTEQELMEQLKDRAKGNTTFHNIFGSKKTSTFLPAREKGSSQQRGKRREEVKKELRGQAALWQNNCLINAICQAAHHRNATMEELLQIRFNLNNMGEMMLASQRSIDAIRNALGGINNPVTVHYPAIDVAPNEDFLGVGPALDIYHTGALHFQDTPPHGVPYK